VHVGIAELAKDVQSKTDNIKRRRQEIAGESGGRERGVDLQRTQETGEGPVESRVADDEGGRHGVGAELVHEQDLQLPLHEVRHDHGEGGLLRARERTRGCDRIGRGNYALYVRVHGGIEVVPNGDEEGVEDQGAEVFA